MQAHDPSKPRTAPFGADPAPPARAAGAAGRAWRTALWIAGAVAIAIHLFVPATQVTTVTLDDSNYTSYAYFTAHAFQYGPQVVPVVGPLGFVLYGFVYAGELFWTRLALDLALKAGLAILLLVFLHRAPQRWFRWVWIAVALAMIPLLGDPAFDFAILFAGLLLVLSLGEKRLGALPFAAAGFLAALALLKGTEFALALLAIGLMGLAGLADRQWRRVALLAGTFAGCFLLCWVVAGQKVGNIPAYFRGIVELSAGYNDAMSLQESPQVFRSGVTVLALLAVTLGVGLMLRWRDRAVAAALLLLGGFTFVIWKHGFVRADGHVMIFFWYAVILAPTMVLIAGWRTDTAASSKLPSPPGAAAAPVGTALRAVRGRFGEPSLPPTGDIDHETAFITRVLRWSMGLTAAGAVLGGLHATGNEAVARIEWELLQLPGRFAEHTRYLLHAGERKAQLERDLSAQRERYALSRTVERVGRNRIDFFGSEHGFLTLNRMKYRPRPMGGGSFSVYTPYLEQLNEAYLRDPRTRPEYLLANLATIDERMLTQDDPRSLLAILDGYTPVDTEQGLLVLQRRDGGTAPREQLIREQSFSLGERIEVPAVAADELLLAAFEIPPSLRGRLRSFLYKSPMLHIDLEGDGGAGLQHRRFIAGMVRLPILFSPYVERNPDLLALYSAEAGKPVRRFRLSSETPENFAGRLTVRFYRAARPTPLEPALVADLRARLAFPVAETAPVRMVPSNSPLRDFNGYLVQMLEPPGEITFTLRGDERVLAFDFGIDPEAYGRGATNGVDFTAEVNQGGAIRQVVFSRLLQPKIVPVDRDRQTARVLLPPLLPKSTLTLRTGPGPGGDGAWDWAYFSKIRWERGAYRVEQFPGFSVAPVVVDNPSPGSMGTPDGLVFMMNAPSRLEFDLARGRTQLEFVAGLLPGAYTGGGKSDGVTYHVELHRPDGSTRELLTRRLDPRAVEADRGDQRVVVTFPASEAGTRLIIRTDAGPNGDASWDWTYLRRLDIK
jgi:hypothetical protein